MSEGIALNDLKMLAEASKRYIGTITRRLKTINVQLENLSDPDIRWTPTVMESRKKLETERRSHIVDLAFLPQAVSRAEEFIALESKKGRPN